MKIALVGNMNNNNFSLMRYFRDLGADAHLLLWSTDGWRRMDHFTPQNDSWDIDRWRPFIHQTTLRNSGASLVGSLRRLEPPPSARKMRDQLRGYDAYIGSGFAGPILARARIRMDVFYPYGTGIEGVGDRATRLRLQSSASFRRLITRHIRNKQIAAIRKAKCCLNAEMSLTRQTFEEIDRTFVCLAVPMVYNREQVPARNRLPLFLREVKEKLLHYDFRVLSHCRQMWVPEPGFTAEQWERRSKHNDWLIKGFSDFRAGNPQLKSALILLDYGSDVQATRDLTAKLGVDQDVIWLPTMSRKEILCLLGACDIGVGEFANDRGLLWGGTGWEVMAVGKPLLQSVNFTNDEFRAAFGHDLPPVLDVKRPEDVTRHLVDLSQNRDKIRAIGQKSKEWFETNNGIGLAGKWLELLESDTLPEWAQALSTR
jgi:hypothetical protein